MIDSKGIILTVICGLIVTVAVDADMVSVFEQDAWSRQSLSVCDQANLHNKNLSQSYSFPDVANLDSWSIGFFSQTNTKIEEASEKQYLQSFRNGPGSLNLCLSALIGLGLCSSTHFIKKFSFCFVPEWYHNGGPFQVGHSYAITPESLYSVQLYCFVQPICTVEDSFTQNRLRTVVSLWRESQFTPAVIASRGPPDMS